MRIVGVQSITVSVSVCLSVCMSVCLSACIFQKLHIQILSHFRSTLLSQPNKVSLKCPSVYKKFFQFQ